ncbi:DUF4272 domain-containing protein [Corynebacterium epidermidicanis]|uniref:Putative DUF4272 family protein n=1 Tax=Corynebacterium epidermidicanis TaxID=1050174 RepID=A0A0G3GM52_9CORY|nr:DUF4272 domain-containing protein [Corynebacterium epidermidicanis]AKK02306.1 putative DUF4272 family protein [Corynebacterium epidermidicanis]
MSIFVNAYSTVRDASPKGDEVSHRGFATAESAEAIEEIQQHLYDFAGYVDQLGMARFGTMTAQTFDTIDHINHTLNQYVFERPDTYSPTDLTEFTDWSQSSNSIFFIQGYDSVYNAHGIDLLNENGPAVPRHPSAAIRAREIRASLAEDGLTIADTLPPVRAAEEIFSQTPEDVRNRIASLAVLSKAAGTLIQGEPMPFEALAREFAGYELSFEEQESEFVEAYEAARYDDIQDEATQYQWSIIAADTLAWCLEASPGEPTDLESVNPQEIYETVRTIPEEAQLRDPDEICDLHEWIRCLRWHHISHGSLDEIAASICLERHRALAWITDPFSSYEDVDLNT